MNIKLWTTEKLINEYNIVVKHIKDILVDLETRKNDMFLKNQLGISRKYKKELKLELELRGVKFKSTKEEIK